MDRGQAAAGIPVDRQSLTLLPPLHGSHVALQVGGDLLPRFQPVVGCIPHRG